MLHVVKYFKSFFTLNTSIVLLPPHNKLYFRMVGKLIIYFMYCNKFCISTINTKITKLNYYIDFNSLDQ